MGAGVSIGLYSLNSGSGPEVAGALVAKLPQSARARIADASWLGIRAGCS